jgi:hypothetical protein
MTKFEKGLCSSPGCKKKWCVEFRLYHPDYPQLEPLEKGFCAEHWIVYIAYSAEEFSKSKDLDVKLMALKGKDYH